jgi:hypothetical protein
VHSIACVSAQLIVKLFSHSWVCCCLERRDRDVANAKEQNASANLTPTVKTPLSKAEAKENSLEDEGEPEIYEGEDKDDLEARGESLSYRESGIITSSPSTPFFTLTPHYAGPVQYTPPPSPPSPSASFYDMSDEDEGEYNTIAHASSGKGVKLLYSKSKVCAPSELQRLTS